MTWHDEVMQEAARHLRDYYGHQVEVEGAALKIGARVVRLEPQREPRRGDPLPVLMYIDKGSARAGAWSGVEDLVYQMSCHLEGMGYASAPTARIAEALARYRLELVVEGYASPHTDREHAALEALCVGQRELLEGVEA